MSRITAATLGFALLATPLCGFAQDANPTKPAGASNVAQKYNNSSLCRTHNNGTQFTGMVVGIGANWGGTNTVTFTVKDFLDGATYTDTPSWPYTYTQAQQVFSRLMAAYLTATQVTVACVHDNVNGVLLGGWP